MYSLIQNRNYCLQRKSSFISVYVLIEWSLWLILTKEVVLEVGLLGDVVRHNVGVTVPLEEGQYFFFMKNFIVFGIVWLLNENTESSAYFGFNLVIIRYFIIHLRLLYQAEPTFPNFIPFDVLRISYDLHLSENALFAFRWGKAAWVLKKILDEFREWISTHFRFFEIEDFVNALNFRIKWEMMGEEVVFEYFWMFIKILIMLVVDVEVSCRLF